MRTKINKAKVEVREKPSFDSLDEVFNYSRKKRGLISAKNVNEYKKQIQSMNIADLQTHAITLSLKPSRNRAMLEKTLINNYNKHNASLVSIHSDESSVKNEKRVMEILSKGA